MVKVSTEEKIDMMEPASGLITGLAAVLPVEKHLSKGGMSKREETIGSRNTFKKVICEY